MKGDPGFYKRRRGILEHLEAGTINLIDLAVHDYLNLKANLLIGSPSSIPPGICITSATAIHAVCPGQISEKAVQRSLQHLEHIGWIKRWNIRGKHGNYPVLVCRASVHDASGKEYRINGEATTDWRYPKWAPVGEQSASGGIAVPLLSIHREKRVGSREKKTPAAKTAPPTDPRHRPVFDGCFAAYEQTYERKPTWGGKEANTLSRFLKDHTTISVEEIVRRYLNLLNSTERWHAEKHGSLCHLFTNFDVFADGPIPASPQKGAINADQRTLANLRAAGFFQ